MVNELKEQETAEDGSEEEYAAARNLLEGGFLSQLLERLQACETDGFQEPAESTLLLRLLHQTVHLEVSMRSRTSGSDPICGHTESGDNLSLHCSSQCLTCPLMW